MQPPHPLPAPGTGDGYGLTIEVLPAGAGLRLAGDADVASIGQLRAALARLPAREAVHLDLARLRFIDVACTRELIAVTWTSPPRRLVLHDPPPSLRRIVSLLWLDSRVEIQVGTPPAAAARDRPEPHPRGEIATRPQDWPRRALRGILGRSVPPE